MNNPEQTMGSEDVGRGQARRCTGPREGSWRLGPVWRPRSRERWLDSDFDTSPPPPSAQALIQVHPEPSRHGDLTPGGPSDLRRVCHLGTSRRGWGSTPHGARSRGRRAPRPGPQAGDKVQQHHCEPAAGEEGKQVRRGFETSGGKHGDGVAFRWAAEGRQGSGPCALGGAVLSSIHPTAVYGFRSRSRRVSDYFVQTKIPWTGPFKQ